MSGSRKRTATASGTSSKKTSDKKRVYDPWTDEIDAQIYAWWGGVRTQPSPRLFAKSRFLFRLAESRNFDLVAGRAPGTKKVVGYAKLIKDLQLDKTVTQVENHLRALADKYSRIKVLIDSTGFGCDSESGEKLRGEACELSGIGRPGPPVLTLLPRFFCALDPAP